jgi:AcrR family transcriptional regulator
MTTGQASHSLDTTRAVGLRERKKARTREALADAARELFLAKGFGGTTVEEIADACEVSPRTFFRYFATKEDVLFGDTRQRCDALIAALAAQPRELTAFDALHEALRIAAREFEPQHEALRRRAEILQSSPELRAYKAEHQGGWEEAVTVELQRRQHGPHQLSMQELRLLTAVAMSVFRVAFDDWLDEPRLGLDTLVDQGFEQLASGLQTLGHRKRSGTRA